MQKCQDIPFRSQEHKHFEPLKLKVLVECHCATSKI